MQTSANLFYYQSGVIRMLRRYSRGFVRIVAIAATAAFVWPAAPSADQQNLPSAQTVIDRFVKATGGAEAQKRIKSVRARGTIAMPAQGMTGEFEMMAARPNKVVVKGTVQGFGAIEEGYDGKYAWSIDPVTGPSLKTGKELLQAADEAWFDGTLHEAGHVKSMTVMGREQWNARPVFRLKVVFQSGLDRDELFDAETAMLIGFEGSLETPLGTMQVKSAIEEYRTFGALKLPTRVTQSVFNIEQVITLTSYEFDGVPDAAFALPAVIKALIK
jgi:hypothetical protein